MKRSPNRDILTRTARALSPLLEELVFVGGATTELLLTDLTAPEVRPTRDVDAIVEVAGYAAYQHLSERLRQRGFFEDVAPEAPTCRWKYGELILDVMPTLENILGFTNRWYPSAMTSSQNIMLEPDLTVRVVDAPHFLATKLEAFYGRGNGDFRMSHDLEDLILVLDGRFELLEEIHQSSAELSKYLSQQMHALLEERNFTDALPGFLAPDAASQARADLILERMENIARPVWN